MSLSQANRLLYRALDTDRRHRGLRDFYLGRAIVCFGKAGRGDLALRVRQAARSGDDGPIRELIREIAVMGENLV